MPLGTMVLRPLQNAALTHCRDAEGGVLLLGCGVGKTLISLLVGRVLNAHRAILLVPASLREKTRRDIEEYKKHWHIDVPIILSYEKLSRPSGLKILKESAPDLIICDEAHHLKSVESTRTLRLGKFLEDSSLCRLVVMSGTLFNTSVQDFAHLSSWALGSNSPVPDNFRDVDLFDAVLRDEANRHQHTQFSPLLKWGDTPSEALYERLRSCRGVLLTTNEGELPSLQIRLRKLKIPDNLQQAINACFADGLMEEVLDQLGVDFDADAISASQHLWDKADNFALRAYGQMLTGLLYFWQWPENIPDHDWLFSRKAWRYAVRCILQMGIDDFDSPFLIESGFHQLPVDIQNTFMNSFLGWQEEKTKQVPPRTSVWISDYMVEDIHTWARSQGEHPYIVWVDLVDVGERIGEVLSIPYYRGKMPLPTEPEPCVMSISSHGVGKNLQAWSRNLIVSPIADPARWEQMLARTHRLGQVEDVVTFTVYSHSVFGRCLTKARQQAETVSEITGQPQRLVYADIIKEHSYG